MNIELWDMLPKQRFKIPWEDMMRIIPGWTAVEVIEFRKVFAKVLLRKGKLEIEYPLYELWTTR